MKKFLKTIFAVIVFTLGIFFRVSLMFLTITLSLISLHSHRR
jgi:hypothetical protein